jgi:hypothetical protein
MTEPTLTCPTCRTEIKLTESLAAPLIADTRRRYETELAQKEAEVATREAAVRQQQEQVASQVWSEQPCVRPVSAVHLTAGHNALRGSGPGQEHAFDNALAQVGCPDRRIDRLCITCCSPFPTVTSRRMPGRDLIHAASATGSL